MIYHVDIHVYIYLPSQIIDINIYILFFLFFLKRTNDSRFSGLFFVSFDRYVFTKEQNNVPKLSRNTFPLYITYGISAKRRAAVSVGCQDDIAAAIVIFLYFTYADRQKSLVFNSIIALNNQNYSTEGQIHCLREFFFVYMYTYLVAVLL